jgi:murein DD-endopeptidase MepM/ murein hydrolase activator NlpD
MKKKISISAIIFVFLIGALLFTVGFKRVNKGEAKSVYQVYLDGEKIGLIESKDELYDLIDQTQDDIKNEFGVSKVYPPSGLSAISYRTFDEDLKTAEEIYDLIKEKSPFTILGYTVTIKSDDADPVYINILNKEDLEPALLDAVGAFIDTEGLNAYLNNNQIEITDTGTTIENVYFDEKITIKESYLSVDSEIITNQSDLTKYLLFGTLEKQDEYTVKDGDTVETVAYNNKLSNAELLIANPDLSSVNSLLSEGQVLNIGLINPLFTVVEETEVIADVEDPYTTVYETDSTKYASQSYVKQEGVNGVKRVTEKVLSKNGEIMTLVVSSSSVVSSPVNEIVVKGTKVSEDYNFNYYPPAASSTDWGWPTISPYVITSYYGYRWGKLHGGIDISGSGFGSPIYSSTEGTVISVFSGCANQGYYGSTCGGGFGNSVQVQSTTGLTIIYGHIKNNIKVSVGETVTKGQLLGYMGNSGSSTGTHLHFEIRDANGTKLNPCKVAFAC